MSKDGVVVLVANDKWWGTPAITNRIAVWPRGADIQERVNQGSFDVVDIESGSSGLLNLPDDYVSTESPSAGIEQLIFAPGGLLAARRRGGRVALCTPRDVIARNAATPIINSRLSPVTDDAFSAAEMSVRQHNSQLANPDAARAAINNKPLTVRIGYQTPNARLAATVGAIAKSCAAAGITVQDAGSATAGPVALRNNEFDGLLAGTGEAAGSGSSGSSAIDAYAFHSGNGNNLPGYVNERVDGIIDAQAVTSDPKELARLAGRGAPILWNDMPTLPLYPPAAHRPDFDEDVRGEQQPDPVGRRLEHGPLEAVDVSGDIARVSQLVEKMIREVPDFPEPGVQFKDLTPLLADAEGLRVVTDALAATAADADLVAGLDARGFLLGAAVATRLGVGVLAVRKGGSCRRQCTASRISSSTAARRWRSRPTGLISPGATL